MTTGFSRALRQVFCRVGPETRGMCFSTAFPVLYWRNVLRTLGSEGSRRTLPGRGRIIPEQDSETTA